MSVYEGDPKIFLDKNGSFIEFRGGQPVMDQGLENMALISLLTDNSWHGNIFLNDNSKQGSDFEETAGQAITVTNLENTRQAAERALDKDAFGNKAVVIENPLNYRINVDITIEPPGFDSGVIQLEKNGENWIFQKDNPAHKR